MRIRNHGEKILLRGFRVMLFRMVPKPHHQQTFANSCFRVMLFGMVPKRWPSHQCCTISFRVMLFRMVPKQTFLIWLFLPCFIVMLFKNKLSPQAIRNFHHKIRIFIIKDELLQFLEANQVISQNVDRLRLVLPFFRKGFFY
ncbi:hypothetical protein IGK99_001520 [Enterococcus sp. DIV1059_1]